MNSTKSIHIHCCICKTRPPYRNRRRVVDENLKKYVKKVTVRDVASDDYICNKCHAKYHRWSKTESNKTHQSLPDEPEKTHVQQTPKSPKTFMLNINTASKSHKYCFVCNKKGSARHPLVVISTKAQTQAFIDTGVYVENKSRCCRSHLECSYLTREALEGLSHKKTSNEFSKTGVTELISNIRNLMKNANKLNFDVPSLLSDEKYFDLTGLTKAQFSELCQDVPNLKKSNVRSVRTTVAIFLTKMRTGLSNKLLSVMFGLKKSQIQRAITSCRTSLMKHFVPKHLGFGHITHTEFVEKHTSTVAGSLFKSSQDSDEAILIVDGTYIYIQKSMDYLFQRKSYSMHKNRPLVKPMMVVGSDGYILSVFGPYFANEKNNDAEITKHCFVSNSEDINSWLKPNDVFIVDRGFRDAVTFLEERGLKVHMPAFLPKGQKQHTVEEANLSRLVTKVRWVVESVNGRAKQWKMLDKVVPNILVPNIGDFVRIVCALINKFRPPIVSSSESASLVAQKMLQKSKLPNQLLLYLEQKSLLNKRSVLSNLSQLELTDFPTLNLTELREITLGVYQLSQAPNYSREHVNEEGDYIFSAVNDETGLLKVKIQSRHTQATLHTVWIKYTALSRDGEKISGWYCTCKVGARVVGCCAHVASIIWYLGYGRNHMKPKQGMCSKSCLLDAASIQPATSKSSNKEE